MFLIFTHKVLIALLCLCSASAGVKLDTALARRAGLPPSSAVPRRLILSRFHYRVSPLENIKYRIALLRGQAYAPKLHALRADDRRYVASVDEEPYDQITDPWPAN